MIERSETEEKVSGAVKRAWKHVYGTKEAPGDTTLDSQDFKGTINDFVEELSQEGVYIHEKSLSHVANYEDTLNNLEDLWNFVLKENNMPAPVEEIEEETKEDLLAINQAAVAAEEKAGLIDEVKETKEDLLAIHEAAMEAEAEAGSIAEDNEYNVDLTFLGNAK
jgi:hypothetical protein